MINIEMNKTSGVTLATAGKYCEENIKVTPLLQQKQASENGEVTADNGYAGLSKVTVNVASGASLNIAYGSTAPEDTSKLWVNGAEPSKVIASDRLGGNVETLTSALSSNKSRNMSCASVNSNIYIFGGNNGSSSSSYTNIIQKFDTTTETVTTLSATLNALKSNTCSASVGTDIYIFGGYRWSTSTNIYYYNTILKFDTLTETVTILSTTLPNGLMDASCASVGTDIYIFGGQDSSSRYNTILKFDTLTETVTTLSVTLPNNLSSTTSASVGTDIYIFGGYSGASSYNTILKFDTLTETVTILSTTLPNNLYGASSASVGTDIYIFGGYRSATYYNTILKFDTLTETITTLSVTLPNVLANATSASVGTDIYIFGGYIGGASTYTKDILKCVFNFPLPQNQLLINTTLNKNLFKIINGDTAEIEIGVNGVYRGNANNIAELESANVFDTSQYAWVDVQSGAVVDKLASVVNITSSASEYAYNVYDGTDTSGTLRATLGGTNGTLTATIPCYSGYLYFENTNADTTWEDVTVTDNLGLTTSVGGLLFNVNGDGAITATVVVKASGYTVTINNTYSVELVGYVNGTITYADGTTATLTQAGNGQATVSYQDVTYIKLTDIYANTNGTVSVTGTTQSALMSGVTLENDVTIDIYAYPCYIEGTQITLADGSTKAVEDITYEDDLLVWNFYKGTYDTAKPTWIKVKQVASQYNKVTFDNGAEVGFVGPANLGYHRIFNKEAGKFTYTGAPETPNGTTTLSCNTRGGWTKVVSQEIVKEKINFYNIITDKHYNLFANGILTSCRLSNKYAIEDMKYVGDLLITADEEKAYFERIEHLKVKKQ